MTDFFEAQELNSYITVVKSHTGEIMYLIEGENRTVLIDTCVGIRGFKNYIDTLRKNKNPLSVLISHGHIDHAMGAPEFEECYMNTKDIPLYQSQCDRNGRLAYAHIDAKEELIEETPNYKFKELEDGMVFLLGGVSIEVYEVPGHTPGCMVFLIPELEILITGDACNNATFLFEDNCSSVVDYQKNLKSMQNKVSGRYKRIFLMHHIIDAPADLLEQMIELCDDILDGDVDNIPFEFMGKHAYMAKKANEQMERTDGKFANLIYNAGRIR